MLAGSLIFETPIDTKGIESGTKKIKGELGGLKNVANETWEAIQSAFSDSVSKPVALAQARINDLLRQFETVSASLKDAIAADDDSAAEKYGRKQIQLYDQIEAARERLSIVIQEETRKSAEAEKKAAEKTRQAAEKAQKALSKSVAPAKAVRKESSAISKNFTGAGKAVKSFGKRLAGIVASALVFNVISAGLREVTNYMGSALKANKAFSAELAKLKGALLTAFQPIYNAVLPALTGMVQGLTIAMSYVARLFSMLAGTTVESSAKAAEQLQKETQAMQELGGATKKAQKSLAGFDEIQKLGDGGASSGNGSSETNYDSFSADKTLSNAVQTWAVELKAKINDKDWYGVGQSGGKALMSGIESVPWHDTGSLVGEIVGGAVFFALGAALRIDPLVILSSAAQLMSGLMDGLSITIQNMNWQEIGGDLVDFFIKGFITSMIMTNPFATLITIIFTPEGNDLASSAWKLVGSIIGALLGAIAGAGNRIGEIGRALFYGIKGWIDENIDWDATPGEIINGLWEGIKTAIKSAGDWIYNNIWVPFRDGFKEAFDINSPSKKMEEFGSFIIAGLKNGIKGGIEKIKQVCADIWGAIKEKFSCVGDWFEEKFAGAWQKVKDVFSKGGEIFTGIKEGIASTFKTIVNGLIGGINTVLSVPFEKINKMLNTIRNIDILGITPFKELWEYNPLSVPQIPYLAKGAVLPANKPFLAMVGDQKNGTNVEAPLDTIKQALAEVMAAQDGGGDIVVRFEGDLAQLGRVLKPVVEKEKSRIGGSIIRKAGT